MIFIEIVIQGKSTKGQSAKWTYNSNYDGDSVTVISPENKQRKIRLLQIDAPELKQPMGQASRNFLESILTKKNKNLNIVGEEKDRYGRLLGEIYTSDGKSVNKEMMESEMTFLL